MKYVFITLAGKKINSLASAQNKYVRLNILIIKHFTYYYLNNNKII